MKETVSSLTAPLFILSLLLLLIVPGCATLPSQQGDVIGILRVSGQNVMLDNRPGKDGERVRIGSLLTTGPGSSALVDFNGGGVMQLDENTDPVFGWLSDAKCILVRMLKGQAYLDKGHACVRGTNLAMVLESEVNVRLSEDRAEVTLLKGRVSLERPEVRSIQPGQQVTTMGERVVSVRTLSPAELESVVAWRKSYHFNPLPRSLPLPLRTGPVQPSLPPMTPRPPQ